ncbi:gliding motility-associated C-terminal domain-containing protein [Carboxylicivirga caseinilyticus]|uniref:T9SS type B sorting domain-containing protein n=1 Tax=Carboxylicivirga caseinilyticus TaxID=3417572 RepID=UPI003D327966|nr:gliding motility-associated C-terminal domain-containing protein [Marinilabiliaceae bacterium A049]
MKNYLRFRLGLVLFLGLLIQNSFVLAQTDLSAGEIREINQYFANKYSELGIPILKGNDGTIPSLDNSYCSDGGYVDLVPPSWAPQAASIEWTITTFVGSPEEHPTWGEYIGTGQSTVFRFYLDRVETLYYGQRIYFDYIQRNSVGLPVGTVNNDYTFVYQTPSVFNFGADQQICSGESATLTLSGSESGMEYFLINSGGGQVGFPISGTGSSISFTVSTADTYTVEAYNISDNNCASTMNGSATVVVNPLPSASAANTGPVCLGADFTLLGDPDLMSDYEWTYGVGNVVGSIQDVTLSSNDYGVGTHTFTLTIVDSNTCENTTQTTVTVNSIPTVTLSYNAPVCVDGNLTITASPAGGSGVYGSYIWTKDGVVIPGETNSTLVINPASLSDAGQYGAVVTDGAGCSSSEGLVDVSIQELPTPTINGSSISGTTELCQGETLILTGGGGASGAVYEWTLPDMSTVLGNVLTINNISATIPAGETYTLKIIEGTCEETLDWTVIANPTPVVTLSSDQTSDEFCPGTNVTFTAGGADEYIFYKNGTAVGNIVQGRSATNTYSDNTLVDGDIIYVEGFDTNYATDCSAIESITVTVFDPPIVSPSYDPTCDGSDLQLYANRTNGTSSYSFAWSHESNGFTSIDENPLIFSVDKATYDGVYTVVVTDGNSCTASGTVNVVISTLPVPTINGDIAITTSELCEGDALSLTGGGGVTYSWLLPDASVSAGSVLTIPTTVKLTHEGVYTLTVDDGTCTNTLDHNVVINENPIVTLSSDQPGDAFCVGTNVTFTAAGANEYIFYKNAIGAGNIVQARSTVNTYSDNTLVNGDVIIVEGFDTNFATDCSATANVTVTVHEVIASISISSPGSVICAGTPVTFNASAVKTPNDPGAVFNYDFHRVRGASDVSMQNGSSSTYTDNALQNGDEIYVVITETNSGCSDSSNSVSMTVNANPVVNLTVDANPVCDGTTVTFTATVANASATVVAANYEFFVNNVSQQSGASNLFSTNSLADGDEVFVSVTTTASCQASSAPELVMTINPLPTPALSGNFTPCVNSTETYTTDAGFSNYVWIVSGGSVTGGGNGNDYVDVLWTNTGAQSVTVSYETAESCSPATPTVQSITVNSLPTITVTGDTDVCINGTGTYTTQTGMSNYVWNIVGGTIQSNDNNGTITVLWNTLGNGSVSVNYDNANGCSAAAPASLATVVHDLPTPSIIGSNDVCLNSIEQYSTQGGYVNYDWNVVGGTIIPTANPHIIDIQWTSVGLQSVSVNYETINGNCSAVSPYVLDVQVNDLPVPVISGPADVCQNSSGNIYSTDLGMTGYVWSISGGSIDSGNGTESVSVTWNTSGANSISVTYIDGNGCEPVSPTAYPVNVNALPVPTISGSATVCNGVSESYSTESGMSNYVWTVGSGGTIASGQNTESIVVDWSVNGTHTISVTYTDTNACDPLAATSTTINVVDLPTPTIAGDDVVCEDHTVIYTTEGGASNYDWQIVGGTILTTNPENSNLVEVIWTTGVGRQISVNYELASCPAATPFVLPVTVNAIPTVSLNGPTEACLNTTGHVYSTESGQNNYQWNVSGGTITAGFGTDQITVTWDVVGQGSVEVNYDNTSGCNAVAPTQVDVTVHPLPVPTISGSNTVCNKYSEVYSTELSMTNYTWIVTGGTIISGDGTNEITVEWNTVGTQSISVSYTDPNLCDVASPTILDVTVQDTPVPTITGSADACNNNTEVYSTESGNLNYVWTVTGGSIISGSGTDAITVNWENDGLQQITVNYEFANGCSAPSSTVLDVTVNPLSGVSLVASPGLSVLAGTQITFTASGTDVVNYVYKVNGLEDTSHDGSDTYLWTPTDVNDDQTIIRVVAETSTGCKDSTELIVSVFEGLISYDLIATASEYCGDGSEVATGISIYLSGAQIGITYDLMQVSDNSVVSSITYDGTNTIIWNDIIGTETYKVEAYNASVPADRLEMNNQVTITRNDLPTVFNLSPAIVETTCTSGSDIILDGSEVGVEYYLLINGAVLSSLSGDGNQLNFGPQTVVGIYTIQAVNTITGCISIMNNQYQIDVTYSGNNYEVYTDANTDPRDGTYCEDGSGVNIYLSGADDGIVYRLYLDGVEVKTAVGVAGSIVDFGPQTAEGTYTVAVEEGGCYFPMDEYVIVTIQPMPTAFNLIALNNIPSYCPEDTGVKLLLDNQEAGVRYTLFKDGVYAEDILSSTSGLPLEFTGDYTVGTYSVTANVEGLTCGASMANTLDITLNVLPVVLDLQGEDSFCEGGGTAELYINNPETDVDYELMLDSNPTGDFGTISGAQIIWTVSSEGLYTVRAVKQDPTTSCSPTVMNGSVTVTMTNLPEDRTLTVVDGTDCTNGTIITVPNSEAGITYVVINMATDMLVPGYEIIGDGGNISFDPIFDADGYYRVEAYNGSCMTVIDDTFNSPVHVAIAGVVGKRVVDYIPSGPICVGSGGITIRVNSPEADVDYVLYRIDGSGNDVLVDVINQPNVSDPIEFSQLFAEGTYKVIGFDDYQNDPLGCSNEMLNRVTISYNPLPKAFRLYGAEKYCSADPAVLTLDGSEFNYEYILLRNDGTGNVPVETKYGTGAELEFVPVTVDGSYTVYSISPDGCTSSMRDTVSISAGDDIIEQLVSGGNVYEYCSSEGGVTITLADQQTDVLYQAVNADGEVAAEVIGLTAGSPVDLGPLTTGKYAIWGSYGELGCRTLMNNTDSVEVIGIEEPEKKIVTSDAYSVCGSVGTTIRLADSQIGIEYYIDNGTIQSDTLIGDGNELTWLVTESGLGQITYQIIAIANTTCNAVMGTIDITYKDGPSDYTMFAISNGIESSDTVRYCADGIGVELGVNATESGIAYILYRDFTEDIGYISGDGSNRIFSGYFMGAEADTVEYSVRAVNIDTGCEVWWSDTIQVIEDALPTIFDLELRMSNGTNYFDCADMCQGQVSVDTLILNGSELGTSYELLINDTSFIPAVDSIGTANVIKYGPRDLPGYYTVQAVSEHGCVSMMNGMIQLYQEPLIAINDTLMLKNGLLTDSIDVWANDIKDEVLLDKLGTNIAFELMYLSADGNYTQDMAVTTDYGNKITINNRGKLEFKKSPTFYGRDTVRYIVRNTDYAERIDTAYVYFFVGNIDVDDDNSILIPNAFSPNNDGFNDVFEIDGEFKAEVAESKLEVFNRWGTVVYRSKGKQYDNTWDGKSNAGAMVSLGNNLPDGTYFYVFTIKINNAEAGSTKVETREYNGSIEIRR